MTGSMDEHFSCPHCRKPLTWNDARDEWDHPSMQDTVDCVLSYYGVRRG